MLNQVADVQFQIIKRADLTREKGKITLHFDSTNFDGSVNKIADVFLNVEKAPVRLTSQLTFYHKIILTIFLQRPRRSL
jgi:hypothetical protein